MNKIFSRIAALPFTQILLLIIAILLYLNLMAQQDIGSDIKSLQLDVQRIDRDIPSR
jgi:hypothetical protein